MNAQHTPGPWMLSARLDEGYRVHGVEGMIDAIADLDEWAEPGETEANARLIAAAPELLAACRRVLASIPPAGLDAWAVCAAADLSLAIARATGEEGTQ